MELYRELYAPYNGALNNLGSSTADQREAAEQLHAANLPALALFFGRSADMKLTGDRTHHRVR